MARPISPEAVYRLTGVSSPSLSPDGGMLAFVRTWVDNKSRESCSRVMLMELPRSRPVPFTQGTKDSNPRFSPDGRLLAFLRKNDKGHAQIWVMPLKGGEARQLTRVAKGVTDFAWSPDSTRIAFVADVDPSIASGKRNENQGQKVTVVRRIRYRYDGLGWRGDAHFHIFVISVRDRKARQLTDDDWDDVMPTWSPDGKRIAFVSERRPDRGIRADTEAYVVPTEGGKPECWSGELYSVGNLAWSPDSTRLIVAASDESTGRDWWQNWLFVLEPGQKPRRITDDSVRPVINLLKVTAAPVMRWTRDDRVLFLGDARGQTFIFSASAVSGGKPTVAAGGGLQGAELSIDTHAKMVAIGGTSPNEPSQLFLADLERGLTRLLTGYNRAYLKTHPRATLEKFVFKRKGVEIECRLWLPPRFNFSRRYPLILDIHGGPNSSFYDSFNMVQQVLATSGYVVLAVNPRGSCSYGRDFTSAVLGDWGGEDYEDLMAALNEVSARPYIDSERMGVHGYSYGGYMSTWIVGHTDRFKAAVVGAPCIDLPSMYGTSDIGVWFGELQWGGSRAEAFDKYVYRSPITHAHKVNTPVLLLHGEADLRCPIAQSEELFVSLKRNGKQVEFVRFPGCSHGFVRTGPPKMRVEYLRRTLEWFDRLVKGPMSDSSKAQKATKGHRRAQAAMSH